MFFCHSQSFCLNSYLKNRILYAPFIEEKPAAGLKMIVVIPAFNEPNILQTLQSLYENDLPMQAIEVLVVVNYAEYCEPKLKEEAHQTVIIIKQWMQKHSSPQLQFYCILAGDLAKKHAGVGLARKIGMDEAVQRFEQLKVDGIIVNLDADCTVSKNYLNEILHFYEANSTIQAANIHYEHPIDDSLNSEAIILYELYLRYYVEALRYCNYPYAYHTVGSSFSVKSSIYQQQGGMNRRKAGEDFYFLHKIIPVSHFGEIGSAVVFPSARESDRVPFGTGRSILAWHKEERDLHLSYALETFQLIKWLFDDPLNFHKHSNFIDHLPEPLQEYLSHIQFKQSLQEIENNTQSAEAFVKRYHRFWSGFELLKLIHYCRDHFYPNTNLVNICLTLMKWRNYTFKVMDNNYALSLLMELRSLQKKGI